jgi:hypothetical protein
MIKNIFAIVAGYAIFVISSVALFKISGHKPHAPATVGFQLFTAVYGAAFSLLSGYVTQLVARTKSVKVNYLLAVIIAGFAAFSMFKSTGSSWTQLLAIFIFAPISVLGGLLHLKKIKER